MVEPHLSILAPRLRPEAGVADPLLLPLLGQLGNGSLREVRAHKGLQPCHVIGRTNVTECVHVGVCDTGFLQERGPRQRKLDTENISMAGWARSTPAGGGKGTEQARITTH